MGGGDLNLKKRWHPAKYQNMQKVYEAQQEHAQEQKKVEILRKEIAKEREIMEIQRQQQLAGFVQAPKVEKLDWMYTGITTASTGNPVAEDYLLGRKKASDLATGKEAPIRGSLHAEKSCIAKQKDLQKKIKEDPLFAIKQSQIQKGAEP
jgi:hypothetical protein